MLFERLGRARASHGDLRWAAGEARRLRAKDDDIERALTDFTAALALDKPPPQAHRSLGFIYRQQGRKDEAAQALQRYLDALPAAPDAGLLKSYVSELKT